MSRYVTHELKTYVRAVNRSLSCCEWLWSTLEDTRARQPSGRKEVVLRSQHRLQSRPHVQQGLYRMPLLPNLWRVQQVVSDRLSRHEYLDSDLQPCLHYRNDLPMHAGRRVLGSKHPRIPVLQGELCVVAKVWLTLTDSNMKNEPWWISYATTQISTDFALLLMPLPVIQKLSMRRIERLGVCLVFGTGIL